MIKRAKRSEKRWAEFQNGGQFRHMVPYTTAVQGALARVSKTHKAYTGMPFTFANAVGTGVLVAAPF